MLNVPDSGSGQAPVSPELMELLSAPAPGVTPQYIIGHCLAKADQGDLLTSVKISLFWKNIFI